MEKKQGIDPAFKMLFSRWGTGLRGGRFFLKGLGACADREEKEKKKKKQLII